MADVLFIACMLAALALLLVLVARALRTEPELVPEIEPEPAIGLSCYDLAVLDHGDPAELEIATPAFSWPENNPAAGLSGNDQE